MVILHACFFVGGMDRGQAVLLLVNYEGLPDGEIRTDLEGS
jgi:hypothetical protein